MSSSTDVMDEDTRQAVHKALDNATRPDKRVHNVYEREAGAWLKPGLSRRDAVARVEREMALVQTEPGSHANCVTFSIQHSTTHRDLQLTFAGDQLVRFDLLPINGQSTD